MTKRRQRTLDENLAVAQMKCVTYPVASWDKRFMRSLSSVDGISEREVPQLWRLFIKYRRQISFPEKSRLTAIAEQLAAPDLRKISKMEREQAEVDRIRQKVRGH